METAVRLTEGNAGKALIKFSIPFILTGLLQSLFNITDLIVAGHFFGTAGSTGIGIGGQLLYLITNAAIGVSAGGTIIVARRFGAKDNDKLKKASAAVLIINIILGVIFTALILSFAGFLLSVLKTPAAAFQIAIDYVRVSSAGFIFLFVFNGIIAVVRGLGNSKFPLYMIAVACAVNAGLDLLFAGALGLGAKGIGYAGIISNAVAAAISLVYAVKKKIIEFRGLKAAMPAVKDIFKLGSPIALLNMAAALSFMGLTFIVNSFGGEQALNMSAAHSIAARYNGFAVLPSRGMSGAIAAVTSQNIGAKKEYRNKAVLLSGIAVILGGGAALFVLTVFFPDSVFKIFGASGEVAEAGRGYLRAMGFDYIILPFAVTGFGLAEGYGRTKVTMAINNIGSLAVRIPAAYLLSKIFSLGLKGIGLSIPLASLVCALLVWIYIAAKKLLTKNPRAVRGFESVADNKSKH